VFALLIIGPPGAGKTEVLAALSTDGERPPAVAERIRAAFAGRL
jgi:predicted ATPase